MHKSFDGTKHKGKIVNYDHNHQLHEMLHADGDAEELWHNEVTQHLNPCEKPKHQRLQHVNEMLAKLALTEFDEVTHTATLDMTKFKNHHRRQMWRCCN